MIYDVVIRGMMPVSNIMINTLGELRFMTGSIDINSLAGSEFELPHSCACVCIHVWWSEDKVRCPSFSDIFF